MPPKYTVSDILGDLGDTPPRSPTALASAPTAVGGEFSDSLFVSPIASTPFAGLNGKATAPASPAIPVNSQWHNAQTTPPSALAGATRTKTDESFLRGILGSPPVPMQPLQPQQQPEEADSGLISNDSMADLGGGGVVAPPRAASIVTDTSPAPRAPPGLGAAGGFSVASPLPLGSVSRMLSLGSRQSRTSSSVMPSSFRARQSAVRAARAGESLEPVRSPRCSNRRPVRCGRHRWAASMRPRTACSDS
jgi:hypothetical protein